MNIVFEIIKISPMINEVVDYHTLIFKVDAPKKIELENYNDLWVFFKTLGEGGALKILVNMQSLDYIDSAGISILINTAKLLRIKKGDIILCNVSQNIRNIFKVINLQEFIRIFSNEGEALNYFRYV